MWLLSNWQPHFTFTINVTSERNIFLVNRPMSVFLTHTTLNSQSS